MLSRSDTSHAEDYGTVVLVDSRYAQSRVQQRLPLWVRQRLQPAGGFGQVFRGHGSFFSAHTSDQEDMFVKRKSMLKIRAQSQKEMTTIPFKQVVQNVMVENNLSTALSSVNDTSNRNKRYLTKPQASSLSLSSLSNKR